MKRTRGSDDEDDEAWNDASSSSSFGSVESVQRSSNGGNSKERNGKVKDKRKLPFFKPQPKTKHASNVVVGEKVITKKKKRLTDADAKAVAAQEEAMRNAVRCGIVTTEEFPVDSGEMLRLPKAFVECDNNEIQVRKGTKRTRNYLMMLPGQLSVKTEGIAGTLSNLGTDEPCLDFEFADQKKTLRLLGSIISPKNSYVVMNFHKKGKDVICDKAYDDIIMFHKYRWINVTSNEKREPSERLESDDIAPIDWDDAPILGSTHADIAVAETNFSVMVDSSEEEEDDEEGEKEEEEDEVKPRKRPTSSPLELDVESEEEDSDDGDSVILSDLPKRSLPKRSARRETFEDDDHC